MKNKLLPLLGFFVATVSPALAITGGPWDQLRGDQFSRENTNGLYEASITLKNGSGFLRFQSNAQRQSLEDPRENIASLIADALSANQTGGTGGDKGGLAARSNSVIFFAGNAYFGNVFGTVSALTGGVNGAGSGQSVIVDQIEQSLADFAEDISAIVNVSGFAETFNVAFTGEVTEEVPYIRFRAEGEANFFSRPPMEVVTPGFDFSSLLNAGAGGGFGSFIDLTGFQLPDVYEIRVRPQPAPQATGGTSTSTTTSNASNVATGGVTGATFDANGNITALTGTNGSFTQTITNTTVSPVVEPNVAPEGPLEPFASVKLKLFGRRISIVDPLQEFAQSSGIIGG